MNRDEILAIAEECGIEAWRDTLCRNEGWEEPMIAFASRIESLVREQCAKICDAQVELQYQTGANDDAINQAMRCAAAIRKSEG